MSKPEKDEFMVGLRNDIEELGLTCTYMRILMYDRTNNYHEFWTHQLRVSGLVSRCMYVTFNPDKKELHVSDQMYYLRAGTKDWQFVLQDPAANPLKILDFFRDLKAVGDKYGRLK